MKPPATSPLDPVFFATPADFRAWLEEHHASARELAVGFYRKSSGRPSITWPEAVDQALCFGWIDGVRHRIDDESYSNRFTPRRPGSNWSAVNIARVAELTRLGLMTPAGLAAFERGTAGGATGYSYEDRHRARFDAEQEAALRADPAAWDYFSRQPPWYRRAAVFWVVSAKKPDTRARRLARLIDDSAQGRPIPPLTRPPRR